MATDTFPAVVVNEFGEPSVLTVGELPIPEPSASQVLVDIRAVGVNPVDTYIRSGAYAKKPTLPYTPGHDSAGVVSAVGADVTNVKPGDRVFTVRSDSGAYARYGLFPSASVGLLPEGISFLQGAAIGTPYATAYRALFQRAHAKAGATVLVHGASGAVGTACLQLGQWAGLKVIGTAGTDTGLEHVRSNGATHAFNHREGDVTAAVLEATGGDGVDIVIEMLANENLQKDLDMVTAGGIIVVVGCRGTIEINPRSFMGKEATTTGVMLGKATEKDFNEIFSALDAAMRSGAMNPAVGALYKGLESAGEAHVEVISRASGKPGKVVIDLE